MMMMMDNFQTTCPTMMMIMTMMTMMMSITKIMMILRAPARLPKWFGQRQLWNARLYSPWHSTSCTGGRHDYDDHDIDDHDFDDHDHHHDNHDHEYHDF